MKSLKQNNTYQILKLRLELIKNDEKERMSIKKFGYGEEAKKLKIISKDINEKLDAIEQDLKKRYDSLELTSKNLEELRNIGTTLTEFQNFVMSSLFTKIESKITELIAIKETATKNYDFKTASNAREEVRLLQKYLTSFSQVFS